MMKRTILLLTTGLLFTAMPAIGEINVNVNLGIPVPVPIIVHEPPLFLIPPPLGLHVAVGLDFDLFRIENSYYQNRDGVWYVGSRYNGPWTVIVHDRLPPGLRKHKLAKVRSWRDEEYRHYKENKKGSHDRSFRPHDERGEEQGRGKGHGKGNKNKKHD